MVNASLNWASIVGIVLAIGGALLYFMRSFKPALARDYDVFFAAVGLLCGGILFFQGWRLDPILQFGQFLLAGTTVFFAYESVRLRGVTTEQARRSSYFDDDEPAGGPYRPQMGGRSWDGEVDRFDEPEPIRRRIRSRDEDDADAFYRPRRPSRAAIPERAASRREPSDDWDAEPGSARSGSRYSPDGPSARSGATSSDFGARRRDRDSRPEPRRGSRMAPADESMPRSSRRGPGPSTSTGVSTGPSAGRSPGTSPTAPSPGPAPAPTRGPQGEPLSSSRDTRSNESDISDADFRPVDNRSGASRPRDNSSRFDD